MHLLGFDHELSDEAEAEMEAEEERLLKSLGWKGKGLIQSALNAEDDEIPLPKTSDGILHSLQMISQFCAYILFRVRQLDTLRVGG